MQAAIDHLWPYTREFWVDSALEQDAREAGLDIDLPALAADWQALVDEALSQTPLVKPKAAEGYITEGKRGIHSEHLSFLLTEMQSLARAHPGATW